MSIQIDELLKNEKIQVYVCGGAVRDILLGHTPKDIDYVVVGATPDEMISKGFRQVGADFPVFLSETGEEYALARKERKISVGYSGFETTFDSSVTLLDDLRRRDLTINSMAVKKEYWEIFKLTKNPVYVIDPFMGKISLEVRLLIHTSEAFAEDPVRVLRTARFAARYGFMVDPTTLELMTEIVHELNYVPTERIWAEFSKGLMEDHPDRMFYILEEVGAFDVSIMKPFSHGPGQLTQDFRANFLRRATHIKHLPSRFALIGQNFTTQSFETHRIPNDCAEMCSIINQFAHDLVMYNCLTKPQRLNIIMNIRAITRPELISQIMKVVEVIYGMENTEEPKKYLFADIHAIKNIDAAKIAAEYTSGIEIKQRLFDARLEVMI